MRPAKTTDQACFFTCQNNRDSSCAPSQLPFSHSFQTCIGFFMCSMEDDRYETFCCPQGESGKVCAINTPWTRCKYCWVKRLEVEGNDECDQTHYLPEFVIHPPHSHRSRPLRKMVCTRRDWRQERFGKWSCRYGGWDFRLYQLWNRLTPIWQQDRDAKYLF